jgi:hypothetical protein
MIHHTRTRWAGWLGLGLGLGLTHRACSSASCPERRAVSSASAASAAARLSGVGRSVSISRSVEGLKVGKPACRNRPLSAEPGDQAQRGGGSGAVVACARHARTHERCDAGRGGAQVSARPPFQRHAGWGHPPKEHGEKATSPGTTGTAQHVPGARAVILAPSRSAASVP